MVTEKNTPGTKYKGWSRLRDQTMAAWKSTFFRNKIKLNLKKYIFLDIPSSYAKLLGGNLFQPWEFLRSGWKAEGVGKERKKK